MPLIEQKQLDEIDILIQKLYNHKAVNTVNSAFSLLFEYILYLCGIASVVFVFVMPSVFPFHVMAEMTTKRAFTDAISRGDLETFVIAVKGLVLFIGVFFLIFGQCVRAIRLKNKVIQTAINKLKMAVTHLKQSNTENEKTTNSNAQEELLKKVIPTSFEENTLD